MGQSIYSISHNGQALKGKIKLAGSKSISNRILIIRALSNQNFQISGLASSKDTQALENLLQAEGPEYDAGPAGTTFRFLTAYFCLQQGTQQLTGSERMLKRPIGPLVDALRKLGADIEYLGDEGFPPLKIGERKEQGQNELSIPATISSQFISALLMIGPYLEKGLALNLEGKIVSKPYIEMTLSLMKRFGIDCKWKEQSINIPKGNYLGKDFEVEADWSAAGYYYSMALLDENSDITLEGLNLNDTLQGDSALVKIYKQLGIETSQVPGGIQLKKTEPCPALLEWNFLECPDLAQTVMVSCAAKGIQGLFSGMETLKIKETDRIAAMTKELEKTNVYLSKMPAKFSKNSSEEYFHLEGKANFQSPVFQTYEDHRMAMALCPLAMLGAIAIEDPDVVVKSYPEFWSHIQQFGFKVDPLIK